MNTRRHSQDRLRILACLLFLALAIAPAAPAREVVPAPENGGPGETVYPPDNGPLGASGTVPIFRGDRDLEAAPGTPAGAKDYEPDTIGGQNAIGDSHRRK